MNVIVTDNSYEVFTEPLIKKVKIWIEDYNQLITWNEERIEENLKAIEKHKESIFFWAIENDVEIIFHLKNKIFELEKEIVESNNSIIVLKKELNENMINWKEILKEEKK